MKKIKPFGKNILVRLIRNEDKSSIIIPETAKKERPQKGEVLAVGDKVKEVKIGETIIFNYPMAHFFEGEGELDANIAKRVIISEDNVYLTYG